MTSSSPQVQCLVDAGFEAQTILPSDEKYRQRLESYWALNARLQPACFVTPRSAQEVADVLKAVVAAKQPFAVRSGGHTIRPGHNNIQDGVTIDLSLLNTVSYDETSGLAKLGPGATWFEVYEHLHQYGLAVVGGRAGDVGVGGLLLGGGKSFASGRKGFACDSVVSYEVVLASGETVTATRDAPHAELFRALKGGGSNFGIVTSFELTTFDCPAVWGGIIFGAADTVPAAIAATSAFTTNMPADPDSHVILLITYSPETKDTAVVTYCTQMAGVEEAPAFKEFLAIPHLSNTLKMTTNHEVAQDFRFPVGFQHIWYTYTFKNDLRVLTEASRLHDETIAKIKTRLPDGDFITQCILQPVPTLYTTPGPGRSNNKNSLGVERHGEDAIQLLMTATLKTPEQVALVRPLIAEWAGAARDFARDNDALLPWVDLNYADASQNPLASYGRESVLRLRRVAAEYDPRGIFQTLCPGGFKISRVRDEDVVG